MPASHAHAIIRNETAVEAKEEHAKTPLDRSEQILDDEKALVMERGDGISTASAAADNNGDSGDIVVKCQEEAGDDEGEDDDDEEEEDASNGFLQLTAARRVPNCCAVCLSGYEAGEKVVWSSNRKCRHAFHRDCIVDWFVKMPDDGSSSLMATPCPCCRRNFTDLEAYRREKRIRWGAEYAFNPSFITFR